MLASAETVEIDGIWYNLITKAKEAEVIWNPNAGQYSGYYSGSIEIPVSVTHNKVKYGVTSIGEYAFYICRGLTSINIPNSVKTIGSYAFSGCSSLTSIYIPNSVTSIGRSAFSECNGLTSIKIPNNVTSIDWYAFSRCSNLTSVDISSSVTSLDRVFLGCSSLTSVIIPNSVTSIGTEAFQDCTSLSSISISNSVSNITYSSFGGCIALKSITIPNNVKHIENQAFANCDELTDVYCLADIISKDQSWGDEGLFTDPYAFYNSYPQYMTLHVPAASIEAYRSTEPWSQFKAIVALKDGDNPEIKKCATPEICYANGKVSLSCETEGVDFISEVTVDDAKKYYDSEFTLSQTYKITVYATKAGYENSDVATREIVIENGQSSLFGDLNKDGKVNVADHVELTKIIMNQE